MHDQFTVHVTQVISFTRQLTSAVGRLADSAALVLSKALPYTKPRRCIWRYSERRILSAERDNSPRILPMLSLGSFSSAVRATMPWLSRAAGSPGAALVALKRCRQRMPSNRARAKPVDILQ